MERKQITEGPPLGPGSYRMRAIHLGPQFDMVAAAKETGGTLASGRSFLLVKRTDALHFLFPFGTMVTVVPTSFLGEPDITEFRKMTDSQPEPVVDDFLLTIDPNDKDAVEFGGVKIRAGDLDRLVLIVATMAQSNTLEHYENVVAEMTKSTAGLTDRMSQGKMPPTGSEMLVFIGQSLAIRRELVSQLSVLDPPESIWEDDTLDRLYHGLRNNFEIAPRMRVVEHKLELIKETAQMVVSINEGRRSHFLEMVIIGLIALEIILFLLGQH